jgi:hypothetical protein
LAAFRGGRRRLATTIAPDKAFIDGDPPVRAGLAGGFIGGSQYVQRAFTISEILFFEKDFLGGIG